MDLKFILLSFIVCIKLKCNKKHIYGLNSDLGTQKAIRKKKKNNCIKVVEPRPRPEPELESPVNQSL